MALYSRLPCERVAQQVCSYGGGPEARLTLSARPTKNSPFVLDRRAESVHYPFVRRELRRGAEAVGREERGCWLKRWRRLGVIVKAQVL
jgi:hypothetical protein